MAFQSTYLVCHFVYKNAMREQSSVPVTPLPSWGNCRMPGGLSSVCSYLGWTNKVTSASPHMSHPLDASSYLYLFFGRSLIVLPLCSPCCMHWSAILYLGTTHNDFPEKACSLLESFPCQGFPLDKSLFVCTHLWWALCNLLLLLNKDVLSNNT